jgi:copper chaperone CopZ
MNRENQKWLGVAALVSAGAASLCCIGPAVFLALGLGGLGAFAVFEQYRPLLTGATALILGVAFYFTYRRREVACEDGTCEMAGGSPKAKAALWSITALAAAFMTAPYWLAALNRRGEPPAAALAGGSYQTVRLGVKGMTCAACAVSIEKALRKVPGVKSAVVDFDKAEAQVTLDATRGYDSQSLLQAVESAGYMASVKN